MPIDWSKGQAIGHSLNFSQWYYAALSYLSRYKDEDGVMRKEVKEFKCGMEMAGKQDPGSRNE